jgi:hypothetical protein
MRMYMASPSPYGCSRTSSSHHHVSSCPGWNKSAALVLAVSIIACIPARTASFPFRSVPVQRRHANAQLESNSIHPGSTPTASTTSRSEKKAFFAVCSSSCSPATTASTLYSRNNDNQDDTPFLVALIESVIDVSKRPFALDSENSEGDPVSALYPAVLLVLAVTQPLSSFLTTLSLFVALVAATRQLIFAPDDDDEPYASTGSSDNGSGRSNDDDDEDDDDDDDRGLQVFLTDGFSLAASFASARLLLPTDLDASSWLAPLSVPPGAAIGVLAAAAGVAFWQSTSRRGRARAEDHDNDPERRLLDLWDQRFNRREREDDE